MKLNIIFLLYFCFLPFVAFSQIRKNEWKFKDDFEKEFKGKFVIDEENGAVVIPAIIKEFPSLSEDEIAKRVKIFADKRVQLKTNDTDNSSFSFSLGSYLLTEVSPYIKTGKHALTNNYVCFRYTYKIDVKEGRVRFSIVIIGGNAAPGSFGSWPQTKYFKKHSRKAYREFYIYAKELIESTQDFINTYNDKNDVW